jgi:hypothetical protein
MTKTVEASLTVQGCNARQFLSVIYGSGEFLTRYHATVNGDASAQVPEFGREDHSRELVFSIPIQAPAMIMRLIGSERLQVVERQVVAYSTRAGRDEIELVSKPRPQMPGGDSFTSDAVVKIADCPGGCRVDATVECSASGPYGLVSIIESFMGDTALKSLNELLDHCNDYVESLKNNGMLDEKIEDVSWLWEGEEGEFMLRRYTHTGTETAGAASVYYDADERGGFMINDDLVAKIEKLMARMDTMEMKVHGGTQEVTNIKVSIDVGPYIVSILAMSALYFLWQRR